VAAQIGGRKVDQMGDGSATPGAGPPAGGDDDAPTKPFVDRAPVTAPWPADLAIPPPPPPPTELVPPRSLTEARPPGPPPEVRAPAPVPPTQVRPPAPEVRAPAPPTEIRPPAPEVRAPPPPTEIRPPAAEVRAPAPPTEIRPPAPEVRAPPPPTEIRPPAPEVRAPAPPTEIRPPAPEVRAPAPPRQVGDAWAATDASPRRPRQPEIRPFQPPTGIVRYGPGVPAGPSAQQPGLPAERVWRTGQPELPGRRRPRLGRLIGSALTVILLAASGIVFYLRFHHPPFHVTGVAISQRTRTGCGVDVTGRIATNGAAGTVSYQWLFQPGLGPPQPLSQSVIAGQRAVYVTVAVAGSGHGRASQTVTLQVLGPDQMNAATAVVVSC
jgi:hypothetical protein